MKQIVKFDLKVYFGSWFSLLAGALLLGAGLFSGLNFNFTVSEGVFLNSPYTIGVMTGFLSLSLLFLALVLGGKLLIREWDFSFAPLVFSTPLSWQKFLWGRFLSFLILVLSAFFVLYLGFGLGQHFRKGNEIQEGIFLLRYAYPFLVLGAFNGVLVCSFLFLLALSTKNKLHLVLGGLLLYIGYLVVLIFSNSPFMNSASPQAESTQLIAALIDPFGLSSYYYQSRDYTVGERNEVLVGFQGVFLINRLLVLVLSFGFIQTSFLLFTPGGRLKFSSRAQNEFKLLKENYHSSIQTMPKPDFSLHGELRSVYSYMKQDLVYAGKGIFLPVSVLLLLFYHGMEIYGQISGGLRIPERYASSGLVSQTILENFYLIGIFLFGFLANDMYWRSRSSGFWVLEDSTILSFTKHAGHLLGVVILILFYSGLLMLEGVFFQLAYGYPNFDWGAYGGILLFNTLPLLLFSVILILINRVFPSKYSALVVSLAAGIVLGTPLTDRWMDYPIVRFLKKFGGYWSDWNGFDVFAPFFFFRLIFGGLLVMSFWIAWDLIRNPEQKMLRGISLCCVVITLGFVGSQISKGYTAPNKSAQIAWMADYETKFRHYEHIPQPTILAVDIAIALFPEENAYSLKGTYSLKNLSSQPLDRLLLNFHPELNLEEAVIKSKNQVIAIDQITSEIFLNEPMTPGGEASLEFDLSYQLNPSGGFSSDNAMLKNGSFLRLSRYFPEFGYLSSFELEDPELRKSFGLGEKTLPKTLEDPKENPLDMISLSMRISTSANQMAFGTGELVRAEKVKDRNFYTYHADSVPFRFAVSSGSYQQSSIEHKGIPIKVYFHPQHGENVDLLLAHAAYALDYCIKNFGDFPFDSISFVEVSSMASGFNATAYPAVIFINEGQAFHSRLKDQPENDVILELAAHEIAHFWWGGNRVLPDQREGAAFLTESLAMYTEMMVYKHRYGVEKMKEKLDLHRQIYQMEKGYFVPQPLSRVNPSFTHLSYSKGALVLVELSELLGEERLNGMLKEFLTTYAYPKRPISLDLINILCQGATDLECAKIRELLEGY